jgi:hypothetical protein
MDDEMNTAEVLRDEAKENRTREILELMRNSKTLEEAGRRVPRDVYQIHAVAAALGMSIEDYLGL